MHCLWHCYDGWPNRCVWVVWSDGNHGFYIPFLEVARTGRSERLFVVIINKMHIPQNVSNITGLSYPIYFLCWKASICSKYQRTHLQAFISVSVLKWWVGVFSCTVLQRSCSQTNWRLCQLPWSPLIYEGEIVFIHVSKMKCSGPMPL